MNKVDNNINIEYNDNNNNNSKRKSKDTIKEFYKSECKKNPNKQISIVFTYPIIAWC